MKNEHNQEKIAKIKKVIAQFTDVEFQDIKLESELTCDLGLTSFDLVSLLSSLEDEFDITGDDMNVKNIKTVEDVCNSVLI